MVADTITTINFVLSFVIFLLAIAVYSRRKDSLALYIGVAFGLFAFSHLANLLGFAEVLTNVLIVVRTVAYLIVVFALLKRWNP
jgi:uncharacterized membrane protein YhfC